MVYEDQHARISAGRILEILISRLRATPVSATHEILITALNSIARRLRGGRLDSYLQRFVPIPEEEEDSSALHVPEINSNRFQESQVESLTDVVFENHY